MTAPAYQPVPTIAQRRALAADFAKRYRDVQAIADFQAARLRYEIDRSERADRELAASGVACCATDVADEATDIPLAHFLAVSIASLGLWAAIGYATWWIAPKVADLIAWILEMNA